jgi:hypothetical protein
MQTICQGLGVVKGDSQEMVLYDKKMLAIGV